VAAQQGYLETIRVLVETGVLHNRVLEGDVNAQDPDAAARGCASAAHHILHAQAKDGRTPLQMAVASGHT
jgi:hypothetical protein